jgi:hypothetical protein
MRDSKSLVGFQFELPGIISVNAIAFAIAWLQI